MTITSSTPASSSWTTYSILVLLRIIVGAYLPGYVHPDEFFQGGQELFFGCSSSVPWEFQPKHAIRSILPPTLQTWLPLRAYAASTMKGMDQLSGTEILILPRLFCGVLSVLLVDVPIYYMTKDNERRQPTSSMWIVATSWPTWVVLSRPFSNGLETMWLAVLLYLATSASRSILRHTLLGIVCALGLFTRFTFVFFAFPVMITYLWRLLRDAKASLLYTLFWCTLGFGLAAALIVHADIRYYRGNY